MNIRGVPVGLFPPVSIPLVHKYPPVFRYFDVGRPRAVSWAVGVDGVRRARTLALFRL